VVREGQNLFAIDVDRCVFRVTGGGGLFEPASLAIEVNRGVVVVMRGGGT